MPTQKMHENEIPTSTQLVQQLLKTQFPHYAALPITPVRSAGTDNAIYRLGDTLSVRLPRIDWATGQIQKEVTWTPRLAPHLPVNIPEPIATGEPDQTYPYTWGIYRWQQGTNLTPKTIPDMTQVATDLAQFILALQRIDASDGPRANEHNLRGVPLKNRDAATRKNIKKLEFMLDVRAALAVWEEALLAPDWQGAPVWFHGDLLIGNVLFDAGRLCAVIDFGGLGVGDPAPDMMIAWSLLTAGGREVFREVLNVDDATWARGRGQALSQAVIFIPYYLHTNPMGVAYARRMLQELLGT